MSVSNTTKRVKEIRRKTRRKFSSEEKIRIVLEVLRILHREYVGAFSFRQDGRQLASASDDHIVLLSNVRTEDLLEEALKRVPRNLTREEWQYFLNDEPYRCVVGNLPDCTELLSN
jgi:hypothetical protein